jgi:hypothetical protein
MMKPSLNSDEFFLYRHSILLFSEKVNNQLDARRRIRYNKSKS